MARQLLPAAVLAIPALLAPAGAGAAAPAALPALAGTWVGVLKAGGADLHLAVHVSGEGAALAGAFDSLDQGALGLPLADVRQTGGALSFAVPSVHGRYEGVWNAAAGRFEGTWSQGGGALPLALSRGEAAKRPVVQGLDGAWDGVLDVGAMGHLRVVLSFATTASGTTAAFSSPDQGPGAVPATTLARTGDAVVVEFSAIKARFEAALSPDGKVLAGRFVQNGAPIALALAHRETGASAPLARARPQNPTPPFPYAAIEVGYQNPKEGNHIAGTLTVPEGHAPFPAVLLITGSGLQDRDETILGHKPFLILADYLTRRGVAVLRVDDRTMGGSTGDVLHATTADFATDVEAGVAFLKTRADVDPRKIGLIGHSEGGLIAPMVAARNPAVAFIVMLAGPGLRGDEIILEQQRLVAKAMGTSADQVEKQGRQQRALIKAVMNAPDGPSARTAAAAILVQGGMPTQQAEAAAEQTASPWFRYFLAYDPIPALKKVKVPVLALGGSLDLQVPAEADLAAIRVALKDNPDVTVAELPGLNHLFQTAKTGAPSEYREIEETIAPIALRTVGDWILAHTRP
jgi:dienelactone hydrolase